MDLARIVYPFIADCQFEFSLLAVVHNAAVNICVPVLLWVYVSNSPRYIRRSRIADCMVGTDKLFFIGTASFSILTGMYEGSSFSASSLARVIVHFQYLSWCMGGGISHFLND
jgi:hypothetical protein